jgi:hypothetical protein
MSQDKEFVQHDYKIEIDEHDNNIRKYYLNEEPLDFVPESQVQIGSMVFFDKYNKVCGIVQQRRKDKYFNLYDVICLDNDQIEEVAEFRVYRVAT